MKEKICVLMSTYNGEKYIAEQIQSILNQKGVEICLIVRDDGSTDDTLKILYDYEKKHKLTLCLSHNNYGPAKSFMELLYGTGDFDYYAFADQDDIWMPDKLIKAIENIRELSEQNIPVLYASNQFIYIDGVEKELRFKVPPNYTITGIICGNSLSGCTMVFNNLLKNILTEPSNRPSDELLKIRMHDTWVAAVASYCGYIFYDQESLIDYRIHKKNAVGLKTGSLTYKFKNFIRKLRISDMRYGRSKLAYELQNIKSSKKNNVDIVRLFANARTSKRNILLNQSIKQNCPEKRMVFILKVILGWI